MTIYPVPESLASAYHGTGHALVAITDGQVMKLAYMADLLPDFDPADLDRFVRDDRLAPTIRELQPYGQISFGMISGWEFVEL